MNEELYCLDIIIGLAVESFVEIVNYKDMNSANQG